jgi:Icc protein
MLFIHLSDLHLRDPASSAVACEHAKFVAACLKELAQTYPDAEFCVVTGDMTDQGEPAAYRWLSEQFNNLPFPTIPLIGNHDNRDAFLDEFGGRGYDQAGFIQSELRTNDAAFIFLDTVKTGSDAGTLCDLRLNWLKERLQKNKDRPVILFMHHPPCEIGDAIKDRIKLDNADALALALRYTPNVRHILFGHVHRNISINWNDIPLTSLEGQKQFAEGTQMDFALTAGIAIFERDSIRVSTVLFSHSTDVRENQATYVTE